MLSCLPPPHLLFFVLVLLSFVSLNSLPVAFLLIAFADPALIIAQRFAFIFHSLAHLAHSTLHHIITVLHGIGRVLIAISSPSRVSPVAYRSKLSLSTTATVTITPVLRNPTANTRIDHDWMLRRFEAARKAYGHTKLESTTTSKHAPVGRQLVREQVDANQARRIAELELVAEKYKRKYQVSKARVAQLEAAQLAHDSLALGLRGEKAVAKAEAQSLREQVLKLKHAAEAHARPLVCLAPGAMDALCIGLQGLCLAPRRDATATPSIPVLADSASLRQPQPVACEPCTATIAAPVSIMPASLTSATYVPVNPTMPGDSGDSGDPNVPNKPIKSTVAPVVSPNQADHVHVVKDDDPDLVLSDPECSLVVPNVCKVPATFDDTQAVEPLPVSVPANEPKDWVNLVDFPCTLDARVEHTANHTDATWNSFFAQLNAELSSVGKAAQMDVVPLTDRQLDVLSDFVAAQERVEIGAVEAHAQPVAPATPLATNSHTVDVDVVESLMMLAAQGHGLAPPPLGPSSTLWPVEPVPAPTPALDNATRALDQAPAVPVAELSAVEFEINGQAPAVGEDDAAVHAALWALFQYSADTADQVPAKHDQGVGAADSGGASLEADVGGPQRHVPVDLVPRTKFVRRRR